MLACDIVHEQLVAVHQELGALAVESSMVLAKQTRQANTNTINIVSALVIGVLLQTAGQDLDDSMIDIGDVASSIGMDLMRLSFALPRLFTLQSLDPDCSSGAGIQDLHLCFQAKGSLTLQKYLAQSCALRGQELILRCFSGLPQHSAKLLNLNVQRTTLELKLASMTAKGLCSRSHYYYNAYNTTFQV